MRNMTILLTQTEGRVFGLDMQTLFGIGIQLFNGIILALALGFIFYKPVLEFMKKRTGKIQEQINDATETLERANNLIAEYDKKFSNIEKERLDIIESTHLLAEEEKNKILENARQEAILLKKKAIDGIEQEKKQLLEESRLHIIELSSVIAQKYVSQNIDDKALDRIFEETLLQLEGAKWQN